MSNVSTGTVLRTGTREVNTRRGPAMTYSVMLDDNEWYKLGFKAWGLAEDVECSIEWEDTQYGRQAKNVVVTGGADVTTKPGPTAINVGGGAPKKDTGFKKKAFPFAPTDTDIGQCRRSAAYLAESLMEALPDTAEDNNTYMRQTLNLTKLYEEYFTGATSIDDLLALMEDDNNSIDEAKLKVAGE